MSITIQSGRLTGQHDVPDGDYMFQVNSDEVITWSFRHCLLFKDRPTTPRGWETARDGQIHRMVHEAGYAWGWWVTDRTAIITLNNDAHLHTPGVEPPVPPEPFNYGALTLVEIGDEWNIHEDTDGNNVYLQHVTGKVLAAFDELDIPALFKEYQSKVQTLDFIGWLKDLTHEPDEVDDYVKFCEDCGTYDHGDEMHGVDSDRLVCESCVDQYTTCRSCEERCREGGTVDGGSWVCDYCRSENYTYCEDCDLYYPDDEGHGHYDEDDGRCDCDSPATVFAVRNDGADPLANDSRVTISLGAGEISDEGLAQIRRAIYRSAHQVIGYESGTGLAMYEVGDPAERARWEALTLTLQAIGNRWQAKEGNYTKRLSRHAYKNHGLKLPPALISEVGNIASAHSRGADYHIEVTRELNLPAEEFGNESSCWWNESGYRRARCALKTNGGFGLRTFDAEEGGYVAGRSWVQPLMWDGPKDDEGAPVSATGCKGPCCVPRAPSPFRTTFETRSPDAFMVFNGYGSLGDYAGARVMAHMAGMTYRKVEFTVELDDGTYYVNSNAGYLVAPEEIADHYTDGSIHLSLSYHSDLFATEQVTAAIISTEIKETVNA